MIKYEDAEYANNRLRGTYVRALDNNKLLKVLSVFPEDARTLKSECLTLEGNQVDYMLDALNLEPIPGMNVNLDSDTYYIARRALRNYYRQGLGIRAIAHRGSDPAGALFAEVKRGGEHYFWNAYQDSILSKFPSLSDCLEMVQDYYRACAFSPRFSVTDEGDLVYKGWYNRPVGKCEVEPKLSNKHLWLSEVLEEEMKNVKP